jgi:hypothetical protein
MVRLEQELETALRKVIVARDRLKAASPDAPEYQSTLIDYLQATVHHLAVLAVAQAAFCQLPPERLPETVVVFNEKDAMAPSRRSKDNGCSGAIPSPFCT